MELLCAAWRVLCVSPFFQSLSKKPSLAAGCGRGMPRRVAGEPGNAELQLHNPSPACVRTESRLSPRMGQPAARFLAMCCSRCPCTTQL